jgi:hypothetical protein
MGHRSAVRLGRAAVLGIAVALAACSVTVAPVVSTSPAPPAPAPAGGQPGADACHAGGQAYCALNPQVTQQSIAQTICVRGWTATVRPPAAYTDDLKRQQLQQLAAQHAGDPQWTTGGTEEDHRLPLELGGNPRDPQNLSPEDHSSSTVKDRDETAFKTRVCDGREPLAQAQQEFVARWLLPWPGYRT